MPSEDTESGTENGLAIVLPHWKAITFPAVPPFMRTTMLKKMLLMCLRLKVGRMSSELLQRVAARTLKQKANDHVGHAGKEDSESTSVHSINYPS